MTRNEILREPEYWTTKIQLDLFEKVARYMEEKGMTRKDLAEHLGVSRSYVTQLLNGDADHKLSKIVEISLAMGLVPKMEFENIDALTECEANFNTIQVRTNTQEPHYGLYREAFSNRTEVKLTLYPQRA